MTVYFGLSVGFCGLPPRLMYHDSHGMLEQISGVPRVSASDRDGVDRLRRGGREQQVHVVLLDGLLGQACRPCVTLDCVS